MDISLNPVAVEYYYGHEDELSVDDFDSFVAHPFNKNKKFELIDGQVVLMAGNASPNHQIIKGEIFGEIRNYLKGKTCRVFDDLNLYLFREGLGKCKNIYQPDIMVCCDESKITRRGYEGVPDLVVEVISKSTGDYDYGNKRNNYIRYGVRELWIADLFINQISVDKGGATYKYKFDDVLKVSIFPDLSIDFAEILAIVDKSELKWFEKC